MSTLPTVTTAEVAHRELIELSARYATAFRRWLDGSADGLTYPRLRLLEVLHCQGPAKMRALADTLGLSARNLTTLADSAEDDGLVRRVAHPTDRRATLLELTASGQAAADEVLAPRLAEISLLFDALLPAERDALAVTLQKLLEAMIASRGACAEAERAGGDA